MTAPTLKFLDPIRFYDPVKFPRTNSFWSSIISELEARPDKSVLPMEIILGYAGEAGIKGSTAKELLRKAEHLGVILRVRARSNEPYAKVKVIGIMRCWAVSPPASNTVNTVPRPSPVEINDPLDFI